MAITDLRRRQLIAVATVAAMAASLWIAPAGAWEPTRNVEFIVPAGTGGGADQMARMIQGDHRQAQSDETDHGGREQGAAVPAARASSTSRVPRATRNKLVITLSNLFTTPLATGIPFSWKDMTPVAMLALDEFVLWVNADLPYKTVAGVCRRPSRPRRTASSRWAAPAPSRKTRSSPSPSKRRPATRSPMSPTRAAEKSRSSSSASIST